MPGGGLRRRLHVPEDVEGPVLHRGGKPAVEADTPADKTKDNLPSIEELLGGPKDDGEKPKK